MQQRWQKTSPDFVAQKGYNNLFFIIQGVLNGIP